MCFLLSSLICPKKMRIHYCRIGYNHQVETVHDHWFSSSLDISWQRWEPLSPLNGELTVKVIKKLKKLASRPPPFLMP